MSIAGGEPARRCLPCGHESDMQAACLRLGQQDAVQLSPRAGNGSCGGLPTGDIISLVMC